MGWPGLTRDSISCGLWGTWRSSIQSSRPLSRPWNPPLDCCIHLVGNEWKKYSRPSPLQISSLLRNFHKLLLLVKALLLTPRNLLFWHSRPSAVKPSPPVVNTLGELLVHKPDLSFPASKFSSGHMFYLNVLPPLTAPVEIQSLLKLIVQASLLTSQNTWKTCHVSSPVRASSDTSQPYLFILSVLL